MAAEKQSGAYKITSVIFTPGPANSVLAQVNFEGTAPGYGTVLGTDTFVVGKSGTYSDVRRATWTMERSVRTPLGERMKVAAIISGVSKRSASFPMAGSLVSKGRST
jgi:hypothetical protein